MTRFGGFFDSVVDRYSDASLFFGLLVFYARGNRFFYVVLTAFVMISSIMVSYTRARAESLIPTCKVGFIKSLTAHGHRVSLGHSGATYEQALDGISAGARHATHLFNRMTPALWVIAVISTLTVIHRIQFTWQQTHQIEPSAQPGRAA